MTRCCSSIIFIILLIAILALIYNYFWVILGIFLLICILGAIFHQPDQPNITNLSSRNSNIKTDTSESTLNINIPEEHIEKSKIAKRKTNKKDEAIKIAKLCFKYPELNDFYISTYDTPTQRQIIYALKLGVTLQGQTFKEISKCIDEAKAATTTKRRIYIPDELEDVVYEFLFDNSLNKPVTLADINNCFEQDHIIIPEGTTYGQLNKVIDRFVDKVRIAKCPYCGTMIYNGEATFAIDSRCYECNRSLKNMGILVEFNEKGGFSFSKNFYKPKPWWHL